MGAIVSRNDLQEDRNCPSAVLAAKAKIRQDLLKVHLKRINVKENGHKEEETEDWTPEWFPPGIHYPCKSEEENNGGPLHSTYGQIDWMNNSELSSKDLHKAMFNMSRESKHYYMRLVQVTPLHPSEINLESDIHHRCTQSKFIKMPSIGAANELPTLAAENGPTITVAKDSKGLCLNGAIRKVAPLKKEQSNVRMSKGLSSGEACPDGSSQYDNTNCKRLNRSRAASSPVIKLRNKSSKNNVENEGSIGYPNQESNFFEGVMPPNRLDAHISENFNLQDNGEEENEETTIGMVMIAELESDTETIGTEKQSGYDEIDHRDESKKKEASEIKIYNQQEPAEYPDEKNKLIAGDVVMKSVSLQEDSRSEDNKEVTSQEEQLHTMPEPSAASDPSLRLKASKQPLNKTAKAATQSGTSVAAQTIVFPLEGAQYHHSNVKLFPSKLSKPKQDAASTTKYRMSLEGRNNKKAVESKTSPSPTQLSRMKARSQIRGLHGWNLPQHLVKRKMDALENKQENLHFLQHNQKVRRDSISALIEKYRRVRTTKITIEGQKSQTATAKSRERKKYEQVRERLRHLEKLKKHEDISLQGMMEIQRVSSGHNIQKDYEMDIWLSHVQHQQQQLMRQKLLQEEIQPRQLPPQENHSASFPNRIRMEEQREHLSDTTDKECHNGDEPSSPDPQYCTTVPVCSLPVENRPLYWILGKACGEWRPTPNNVMRFSNQRNEKTKGSIQQEEIPEENENMDSLVQLLYEEVAEGAEEERENGKGEIKEEEEETKAKSVKEEEKKLKPAPTLSSAISKVVPPQPPQGISATVKMVMAAAKVAKKKRKEEKPDKESILMTELDDAAIRRASEFRGGIIRHLTNLTDAIQMEYHRFLTDVDYTNFYASRQIEAIQAGEYTPRTVLLISSTVPKCEMLKAAALPDVLVHIYDYHGANLDDLLNGVSAMLKRYKEGAKAKYLGIVCKGGPGYFYLVKKMPVTPARIRNNEELLDFWQSLGNLMSKLVPDQSVIHLMESNVAGNKQGEKLLQDLASALLAHRIRVESPLELAPSGKMMLETYFNIDEHRKWKEQRYKM